MSLPVMDPAKRGNEFVAGLAAKRARLHEAQVMGIRRFAPAHETGLSGDKPEMLLVAIAARLGNRRTLLSIPLGRSSLTVAATVWAVIA